MFWIKNNGLVVLVINLDDVYAVIMGPAMLDLTFAGSPVYCFIRPLDVSGFESLRVNAVDRRMAMNVVSVDVDRQHVLMFRQT